MVLDKLNSFGIKFSAISERIHVIQGNNRSRSPYSNAILILDEINALLDAGCGLDIIEKLASVVSIDLVINSHSHPDHTSGNWLLQKLCRCDIKVPDNHKDSICDSDKLALRLVGPDIASLWKTKGLSITGFRNFTPTDSYNDGDIINLGHTKFISMYTPGHLEDHYCLWDPDRGIFIGFDIDLSPFGPWYGNEESDIDAFRTSIARVKEIPFNIYVSSHARPVKRSYFEKRVSIYEKTFADRDDIIHGLTPMDKWISLEEITRFSPIYGYDYSKPDPILFYYEQQMIKKHLTRLVNQEKVICEDKRYMRRNRD